MNSDVYIAAYRVGVEFSSNNSVFGQSEKITALRDVSFEINKGDSLGIIGRNGCGKSTLLRLIAGIIKPNTGHILNNNVSTALLSLGVGFDPELDGRANALICGLLCGYCLKEVRQNMQEIIEFSELGEFIDKPVKCYSAGMRMRLGFSITLNMEPDILLIDEVLGVGDAKFQEKSISIMKKKLLSDQTIVFVSHSSALVKELCNKVLWIENGAVKEFGETEKVVLHYQQSLTEKR